MREDIFTQFHKDGFLIVEDFLTDAEVTELKSAGEQLASNIPIETRKAVFNTTDLPQNKDAYFLESGDKISYFFEPGSINADGELLVEPSRSLNKIGHNLHWLHPTFRKYSFCERVKELCFRLRMEDPVLLQSMYIYKNPGIGSEVSCHQDSTFLYTEPITLVGLWIALEDATIENGCLWFAQGSHKSGTHRRYIRNPDTKSDNLLIYDAPSPFYPSSNFQPQPVKKGSCIIIHGEVVHHSLHNKSDKSRHVYTFHIMDAAKSKYSLENWLQVKEGFKSIYKHY